MASNPEKNGAEGLNMTTVRNKPAEPQPPAAAAGDNRGADDIDGNKAGAAGRNKAPGPDEPEVGAGSQDTIQSPQP